MTSTRTAREYSNMTIDNSGMKTIAAGAFKTNCLSILDEVQSRCEPVLITKRGKPVAKLVPVNAGEDDIYGFLVGKGAIRADVVAPVTPLDAWKRLK